MAKFYIYRNLHADCFSIRYKGKVIDRQKSLVAYGVEFKVNESGRQRVLLEKRKNVHAFVVAESYQATTKKRVDMLEKVYYNPYKINKFVVKDAVIETADKVVLQDNACFVKYKG